MTKHIPFKRTTLTERQSYEGKVWFLFPTEKIALESRLKGLQEDYERLEEQISKCPECQANLRSKL